jgi:hypothetical protein
VLGSQQGESVVVDPFAAHEGRADAASFVTEAELGQHAL